MSNEENNPTNDELSNSSDELSNDLNNAESSETLSDENNDGSPITTEYEAINQPEDFHETLDAEDKAIRLVEAAVKNISGTHGVDIEESEEISDDINSEESEDSTAQTPNIENNQQSEESEETTPNTSNIENNSESDESSSNETKVDSETINTLFDSITAKMSPDELDRLGKLLGSDAYNEKSLDILRNLEVVAKDHPENIEVALSALEDGISIDKATETLQNLSPEIQEQIKDIFSQDFANEDNVDVKNVLSNYILNSSNDEDFEKNIQGILEQIKHGHTVEDIPITVQQDTEQQKTEQQKAEQQKADELIQEQEQILDNLIKSADNEEQKELLKGLKSKLDDLKETKGLKILGYAAVFAVLHGLILARYYMMFLDKSGIGEQMGIDKNDPGYKIMAGLLGIKGYAPEFKTGRVDSKGNPIKEPLNLASIFAVRNLKGAITNTELYHSLQDLSSSEKRQALGSMNMLFDTETRRVLNEARTKSIKEAREEKIAGVQNKLFSNSNTERARTETISQIVEDRNPQQETAQNVEGQEDSRDERRNTEQQGTPNNSTNAPSQTQNSPYNDPYLS